jgi:hypothetical protein
MADSRLMLASANDPFWPSTLSESGRSAIETERPKEASFSVLRLLTKAGQCRPRYPAARRLGRRANASDETEPLPLDHSSEACGQERSGKWATKHAARRHQAFDASGSPDRLAAYFEQPGIGCMMIWYKARRDPAIPR